MSSQEWPYALDGIALTNPGMGWRLMAPTRPLLDLQPETTVLRMVGVPGDVDTDEDPLAALQAPAPTFVVRTPRANYEALLSLFLTGRVLTNLDHPAREARVRLLGTGHTGYGPGDALVDVAATLRVPGVFWRDTVLSTSPPAAIGAASVSVDVWPMTGLVTDAIVRVRGPVSGLLVSSGRASFRYLPALPAGSYLRYEAATGRAFLTTTDTWTGGTAVSGQVNADGPGDKFAIYPARVSVAESIARLTVTTTTRGAGAQVEVRGKGAHLG